jgi:hypothetical protein
MNHLTDYPLLVLALVFLIQWLLARIGSSFLRGQRNLQEEVREDFGVVPSTKGKIRSRVRVFELVLDLLKES